MLNFLSPSLVIFLEAGMFLLTSRSASALNRAAGLCWFFSVTAVVFFSIYSMKVVRKRCL